MLFQPFLASNWVETKAPQAPSFSAFELTKIALSLTLVGSGAVVSCHTCHPLRCASATPEELQQQGASLEETSHMIDQQRASLPLSSRPCCRVAFSSQPPLFQLRRSVHRTIGLTHHSAREELLELKPSPPPWQLWSHWQFLWLVFTEQNQLSNIILLENEEHAKILVKQSRICMTFNALLMVWISS